MPELAGDADTPGTCRNRQKWVPQAWIEAKEQAEDVLKPRCLRSKEERAAASFGDEVSCGPAGVGKGGVRGGGGVCAGAQGGVQGGVGEGEGEGGAGGQGLVYDLLSVVVHRGSAYSGHYHAFIRDCLHEVRGCDPSFRR